MEPYIKLDCKERKDGTTIHSISPLENILSKNGLVREGLLEKGWRGKPIISRLPKHRGPKRKYSRSEAGRQKIRIQEKNA